MFNLLKFVHLLCTVIWLGMLIFFTFFVAPSIFKVLPKDVAGTLVAEIFPKYWVIGYISGVLSLFTLFLLSYIEKGFPAARFLVLLLMTLFTFYSGFGVSAKARVISSQISMTEDPAKKESLKEDFKKAHFWSATLNMVVIILGIGYIYMVARNLRI